MSEAKQKKGFYSKMFCMPKPGGKWRPIIDLRSLNEYIKKETFKMDTIESVKQVLVPGAYAALIDLKDAYYHVGIHESRRKYLRFIIDGEVYEFKALPMGLTCSLRIFTGLMRVAVRIFRRNGIWIVIYIDDILIVALTKEECQRSVAIVRTMLEKMGFIINLPKSCLEPMREFVYLGYLWDTVNWTV